MDDNVPQGYAKKWTEDIWKRSLVERIQTRNKEKGITQKINERRIIEEYFRYHLDLEEGDKLH